MSLRSLAVTSLVGAGALLLVIHPLPRPALPEDLAELLACNDRSMGGPALRRQSAVAYDLEITEPRFRVRGHYRAERRGTARIDIYSDSRRVFAEWWNGTTGWQLPRGSGDSVPMSVDGQAAMRHGLESPGHLWTLADMPRLGNRVEWATSRAGATGEREVHITLRDGFDLWYAVNLTTCQIVRSRTFRAFHPDVDSARAWLETHYADFAERDGVTRPMTSLNVNVATGDTIGRTRVLEVFADTGR